ncbi:Leucine-rich repeat [Dillenia turbinata]|uniref:Leucine-rich repeat n=1 Tax=Dillenia turbinata TaxID=194707 RepID=A0AAN8VQ09_9MAGN
MVEIGCGLSSLQSLDVSFCRKLTDKGLSAVALGCHDLRSLHLAGCRFITDGLLKALSENCPNLEKLVLQGCTNITDSALTGLVSGCQLIKHLDINNCSNVGDSGISTVSQACAATLRTLKLLDCFKVGNESILSLASFCRNLETLIIGGCRGISDESIKSLAAACSHSLKNLQMDRNLEDLDIRYCQEVTDDAFRGLDDEGSELKLRLLKVSNHPRITVTGIGLVLRSCNSLEYLDVRSCPHITKPACAEAGLHFPGCCKVIFVGSLSEPDL